MVKAVNSESEERVAEEGADVVYHLAVLLLSRGLSMAEVLHVLNGPPAGPMNAVEATTNLPGLEPDLRSRPRAGAERATVVPVRYRFIDDRRRR